MRFSNVYEVNSFFALIAKVLEGAKVLIISVLIARYYGPEDLGRFSFVLGFISIVAVFAEFRLQSVLTKEISEKTYSSGLLLGSAISINLFFSIMGLLIIGIYAFFESDDVVKLCMLIYSASFFFKVPRCYRAFFIANEKNKIIAICEIWSSLFMLFALSFCVYRSVDLYLLVLVRSLDFLVFGFFSHILFLRDVSKEKFVYQFDMSLAKRLIRLSAPFVLSGFAMILFQRVDLILVRQIIGDYSAGIYSASLNITLIFSIIPLVVSESIAPKMYRAKKNQNLYGVARQGFVSIVTVVGFLMSIIMFIIGGFLLDGLYGSEYSDGFNAIKILSLCPILIALGAAAGQVIVSDECQQGVFGKSVIALVVTIVLNFVLIPIIGIEGAAVSTVTGLLLANFLLHFFIRDYKYLFKIQCLSLKNILHIKM
jgi:O-antigen/teichoic acid export membrane protein